MATNAQALFRQGIEALKAGDKVTAHRLLSEAAERVPHNQDIWLWLSDAAENDDQRREYIERALAIDPQSAAGQKAQKKLDRLSAAASADSPTRPGSVTPGGDPPFPGDDYSETPQDTAMPPFAGDPAISDGPPLPGSTTWPGDSSLHDLPPWAAPMEQPETDEEFQEDEDQPFWKKIFSSPWGWAALVGVVVFAFVLIWAIGLAILGNEPEQTALSAERVIRQFQQAGLEAAEPRPMTTEDYGQAPMVCQDNSMRFLIPSLGVPNAGGRVFVCPSTDEVDRLKLFYAEQGQRNPTLRSWTFDNDQVLVQLNGGLSQEQAERYGAALNELSIGEPVVPQTPLDDTIPTNTTETLPYPLSTTAAPVVGLTPTPELPVEQPTTQPAPTDDEIIIPTPLRDTPVPEPAATNPPPPPPPVTEPTAVPPPAEPTPEPPTPEPPTNTTESLPPPEPPETATPEPLEFTNTGSQVIESFSLPSSTSRVSLEYDGESFFRVIAINTGNREETLLVETEGPYRGEKLLIGDAPYSLDVEADGAWTIRIEAVDMADGPLESLDGMGDFVSDFFMPTRSGEVPYTFSHQGVENFRVVLRCADGEVTVQDTVGLIDAEGVVPFGEGPCLWIVEADDTWQIMPQE